MSQLDVIISQLLDRGRNNPKFGHSVKFDLSPDGVIFLDGTQFPPPVTAEDKPADLTLKMHAKTLKDILDGNADATVAFMTGKIKVQGKLSLAMKLNSLLEE